MEDLTDRLEGAHVDDTGTGDSDFAPKIIIEGVDGEVQTSPIESPPRPSSEEVLARVLNSRLKLNLTGKVFVEPHAIKMKHGGAADVYEGLIIETNVKVAVKRLRLNIGGSEKIAKVRCQC